MASDYGLSTTGVAGPDPAEGKPVGRVFVAVAGPGTTRVQVLDLGGDREAVRRQTVLAVLRLLGETLDLAVGEEVELRNELMSPAGRTGEPAGAMSVPGGTVGHIDPLEML